MNNSKKIPIKYSFKPEVKLINNGNIKLEEDYVFEGTNKITKMKGGEYDLNFKLAYNEIKKYFSN